MCVEQTDIHWPRHLARNENCDDESIEEDSCFPSIRGPPSKSENEGTTEIESLVARSGYGCQLGTKEAVPPP